MPQAKHLKRQEKLGWSGTCYVDPESCLFVPPHHTSQQAPEHGNFTAGWGRQVCRTHAALSGNTLDCCWVYLHSATCISVLVFSDTYTDARGVLRSAMDISLSCWPSYLLVRVSGLEPTDSAWLVEHQAPGTVGCPAPQHYGYGCTVHLVSCGC